MDIHRPGPHPLRRTQPGQELVAGGVVRRLCELLKGQHRRRGQQEHHPQVQADEEHQHLGAHNLHPGPDTGGAAVDAQGVQCRQRLLKPRLRRIFVPGIVGQEIPAVDVSSLGRIIRPNGQAVVRPESVRRVLAPAACDGVVHGLGDGPFFPGAIHRNGQREGALCLRIKAPLRQQGGEVHLSLLLRVEDQLHVLGGLLGRHLLHRVVEPYRAGGDANGQQEHEADHRHGAVGGVDAGVELPQDKHIEVPVVEPLAALAYPQKEPGQGAKEEQGAQAAQADHHPEQRVHPQQAPGEEHGVGDGQQPRPRQKENHRHPQALGLELLIHPPGLHQIQEPAPGDGKGVAEHYQQEDKGEGQGRFPHGRQGDRESELRHGHGEEPGGEGGQAPGRQHPQPQACQQGQHPHAQGFQQEQAGHLPPLHAQQQVGAQLSLRRRIRKPEA